ncbi:hypothetical protein HGRIS_001651 [Hohenbuehelia grisea]|uniref:Uncharacterized protein n=1 Tax=Hohenbuehelia grisea TaxID=104357 RepID=A0ABR3JIE9_9AGAR
METEPWVDLLVALELTPEKARKISRALLNLAGEGDDHDYNNVRPRAPTPASEDNKGERASPAPTDAPDAPVGVEEDGDDAPEYLRSFRAPTAVSVLAEDGRRQR